MAGTLFVVATPIGNLEDLSFRALRTLKEVDVIAAEDTRRTAKLLAHYAIQKPMVSLREHNERRETPKLVARLTRGESVALVSDAGTPGVSDPGEYLVRAVRDAGIRVSPIPGPSAVMAALSASGVPASEFVFLGFPPRSGTDRTAWFSRLVAEARTVVFFEAPHRISRTIDELMACLVKRQIYIHREITKINEEYIERPNMASGGQLKAVGEFVIVVDSDRTASDDPSDQAVRLEQALLVFDCLTNNSVFNDREAERLASTALSVDPRSIRNAVKKSRIARKRRDESLS